MNLSRIVASVFLLSLLCGCPTAAQRQLQTIRTGNQQAFAEVKSCVRTAYNSPEIATIRSHMPSDVNEATLQQLSDQTLAMPSEVHDFFAFHTQIQACRKKFLENLARSEPDLVPVYINSYNKSDDAAIALTSRKITWGEFLHRWRDRAAENQAALQAADRQVVSDLKEEHAAEMAQRQRAADALAAWAQTQQLINAANRPIITNCSGFGNSVNCVTR